MDSSGSMEDSRQKLEDASKDIAKAIGNLTSDFRLGFGSYNDKPTFPFSKEIDSYTKDEKNPPYAFKHEMNLTTDTEAFKKAVKTLKPFNNVDSPESGLDAIAQALLCDGQDGQENIINWRNGGVQKVIIVITDQEMHYAGLITISKRLQ